MERLNIKELELNRVVGVLSHTVDKLGMPIDENVKEAVAALNLLGIPTYGSCGGHISEDNLSFPYIGGEAPDEPEFRFLGEQELKMKIADKYSIKQEEIFDDGEIEREYWNEIGNSEMEETEEFKAWNAGNTILKQRLSEMLDEFYTINGGEKLFKIGKIFPGYRLDCVYNDDINENTGKEELKSKIIDCQEQLQKFTEFLKNKYFG